MGAKPGKLAMGSRLQSNDATHGAKVVTLIPLAIFHSFLTTNLNKSQLILLCSKGTFGGDKGT